MKTKFLIIIIMGLSCAGAPVGLSDTPQEKALAAKEPLGEKIPARDYDIVVYGDASGGISAAIQGARMGKSVILVSQYGHLGGMTSSGLGFSDIGNPAILGGISREFYHRIYKHYEKPESWVHQDKAKFSNRGQGSKAFDSKTELASTFEPKVAEMIFDQMIKEAGVTIIKGKLDLRKKATLDGKRIKTITLVDGQQIEGKIFIDASYEGDLLAAADVSFMVGRESNTRFDEQGNGNTGPRSSNNLPKGIDPYIVKGDPASGLLPFVNPDMGGKIGDADHRLQSFCYRTVLTNVSENRVMIAKPEGYTEADYELLFRSIEAGQKGGFFKLSPVPNAKTDSNNLGGISMDYIGANYGDDWNWTTLTQSERETLAAKHRQWQLGLIWTVQNHPSVPKKIRDSYAPWGLAKDEFTDNNYWPYNLYVREGRRMHSDFVMTEKNCRNQLPVEDPIGMGAYTLDSHNTQRFVQDGMVRNEGDIQLSLKGRPYGIAYRSIVPKRGECENLLVPWALSSSHIAFGSIRMEPVFMILGQSSAMAAAIAIDSDIPVQEVPYTELRKLLLDAGQILEYDGPKVEGIVVDDEKAELTGTWTASSSNAPFVGFGYRHDDNSDKGKKSAKFSTKIKESGDYSIRVSYPKNNNRASNAPVTVGDKTILVNQRKAPSNEPFHEVGVFTYAAGEESTVTISNEATDGHVIIDSVQWLKVK